MKRPDFYYVAQDFKKHFNMLSDLDVSKIKDTSDYEYYSLDGIVRGCHYQLLFTRHDNIVTVNFIYTNFKRPHCDFNFCYSFLFSEIIENFVDFKTFCLTIRIMDGFFYQKQFVKKSHFIR